ncbi:Na+/H+ antiporter NhaA [Sphingobacterium alkalisoli]|uniref:Na(+)/H(+) antiporter NhaA n=1 Tax=Sphingobacterium alkalisoli TaxID=1874115 RepID=A0A4U0H966_9SPHI|nr:Na+/H+ antiporter NhaA [Sphingobacterium alkalisoli]TJY68433.1 Na+/H+ antiporter NhaA [Sphingobacterium alkalisoli]GGH06522.1 Na(+)/H(+) antiporter NhaA [Sphingobacterium alkalisoli]
MANRINLDIFRKFFKSANAGGILLFAGVILSLIIANSPLASSLQSLLNMKLGYESEFVHLNYSILLWINDGLMAIFFLLVGLEIKREIVEGELSSPRKASLPVLAALGGAAVPALIYVAFNAGTDTAGGWGIPMATDIAFALAVIGILGKRIPASLKIFLAASAIVDDLIAIMVIAFFYSSGVEMTYLLYAGVGMVVLLIMNRMNIQNPYLYLIPGAFIWYFVHHSGIHATIAGVLVAVTIPTNNTEIESPLERLEHALLKPVNFLIIPIFAFANTNITLQSEMLDGLVAPLGLGITLGLLLGKPLGIFSMTFLATKLKISSLPAGSNFKHIIGVGLLSGIGFTMSIFIAILSFDHPLYVNEAKLSILITSLLAGLAGYYLLRAEGSKARVTKAKI